MKKQSCKDCLHCKVKLDKSSPAGGLLAYCGMDAWPNESHTETYSRLFEAGGNALAAEYADGCLYYEDMAS